MMSEAGGDVMKKRNILVTALASVLLVALTGSIYAYLSDKDDSENKIIVAENKVEIIENFPDPEVQKNGVNKYTKEISIKNTGNTDAYVRVYLDFANSEMAKRAFLSLDDENADTIEYYPFISGADAPESEEGTRFNTETFQNAVEQLTKSPVEDTAYWTYNTNDGYFYYTGKIGAGMETEHLMKRVLIYNKTSPIHDVDIYVYAESVQTVDKDGNAYNNYQSAWDDYVNKGGEEDNP